jgi:hypothetical protein
MESWTRGHWCKAHDRSRNREKPDGLQNSVSEPDENALADIVGVLNKPASAESTEYLSLPISPIVLLFSS